MIELQDKNIEDLKAYLAELPYKYAAPLVAYLEQLITQQNGISTQRNIQHQVSNQEKNDEHTKETN